MMIMGGAITYFMRVLLESNAFIRSNVALKLRR